MKTFQQYLGAASAARKRQRAYPYTERVNRPLARYVAAFAASTGVSPMAVTWVSFLVTCAGVVVIALLPARFELMVVAYLLLAFAYVLDSADGFVARLTHTTSSAGEWLDHVLDAIKVCLFHGALLVVFMRADIGDYIGVLVALIALSAHLCMFFAETLFLKLSVESRAGEPRGPTQLGRLIFFPLDWGVMIMVVMLTPWYDAFLLAYGALAMLLMTALLTRSVRYFRRLRRD